MRLLARLLAGNNVACNICGKSYGSFLPYLDRANALCPSCGSLERTRLIYYFIEQQSLVQPQASLLHIAPEACLFSIFSKRLGANYLPADKFDDVYSYPAGTQYMDITDIKLADNSVDVVICVHVLEHVQDDRKAISEIYRVLKPGGAAILQVPFEPDRPTTYEDVTITSRDERRKHFGQFDHVRIYGRDYIQRFTEPGFTVEHQDYASTLPAKVKERYVFKDRDVFLLRK